MKYDMQEDILGASIFGKIALTKIGTVSPRFRLYEVGWVDCGDVVSVGGLVMKVTGAEFRIAKTGINKGLMTVMIEGTRISVYVTKEEIQAYGT